MNYKYKVTSNGNSFKVAFSSWINGQRTRVVIDRPTPLEYEEFSFDCDRIEAIFYNYGDFKDQVEIDLDTNDVLYQRKSVPNGANTEFN